MNRDRSFVSERHPTRTYPQITIEPTSDDLRCALCHVPASFAVTRVRTTPGFMRSVDVAACDDHLPLIARDTALDVYRCTPADSWAERNGRTPPVGVEVACA